MFKRKRKNDGKLFDVDTAQEYGSGESDEFDEALERLRARGAGKLRSRDESGVPEEAQEAEEPEEIEDRTEEMPPILPPESPEPEEPDEERYEMFAPAPEPEPARLPAAPPENFWEASDERVFGRPSRWLPKVLAAVLIIAAAVLLFFYARRAEDFRSVFLPGTVINGIDVSGLTPEQAAASFEDELGSLQVELIDRSGGSTTVKASDVKMSFSQADRLQEIKDAQNPWLWPVSRISPASESMEDVYTVDREALARWVSGLAIVSGKNIEAPADAQIQYDQDSRSYKAVPESEGTELDKEKLTDAVGDALLLGRRKIDLDSAGVYKEPAVTEDSPVFQASLESLNQAAKSSVAYTLPDGEQTLDVSVFHNWLSTDPQGALVIDRDKVSGYVSDLAEDTDTSGETIPFRTTGSGTIRVDAGGGTRIDQSAEVSRIEADIRSGQAVRREPEYSSRDESGAGEIGSTYIEISLTRQRLWFYKNGVEFTETEIVSGGRGHATPEGLFAVSSVQESGTISSETVDSEAATTSTGGARLDNGYWIYEAPWRDDFGGNVYISDGTPGSVAVPEGSISRLLTGAQAMTPVVVY